MVKALYLIEGYDRDGEGFVGALEAGSGEVDQLGVC